tara:strand:- start:1437 stop:1679 length:243 start_codon:yes stop_codon:yes gene_type:complete
MIWENHFLVFDVTKGPKVIIEALNTYGEEGWECASMIAVANTNIVAFLKRRTDITDEQPKDEQADKLAKLWGSPANNKKE